MELNVIGIHEMHGQVDPNWLHLTCLVVVVGQIHFPTLCPSPPISGADICLSNFGYQAITTNYLHIELVLKSVGWMMYCVCVCVCVQFCLLCIVVHVVYIHVL